MQDHAVPTRVVASAATGIATAEPYNCVPQTEDTITLLVDWQSLKSSKHKSTAVYTASWTAPLKSGVHSAQHWYYMAEKVSRLRVCGVPDLPCLTKPFVHPLTFDRTNPRRNIRRARSTSIRPIAGTTLW